MFLSGVVCLFQKSVDDLLLGLLLGQAQRHKLDKLFSGNLADSRLVDQTGLQAVGGDLRDGGHHRFVHNDRVTLGMAVALAVAVEICLDRSRATDREITLA